MKLKILRLIVLGVDFLAGSNNVANFIVDIIKYSTVYVMIMGLSLKILIKAESVTVLLTLAR